MLGGEAQGYQREAAGYFFVLFAIFFLLIFCSFCALTWYQAPPLDQQAPSSQPDPGLPSYQQLPRALQGLACRLLPVPWRVGV